MPEAPSGSGSGPTLPNIAPVGTAGIAPGALGPASDLPFTDAQVEEFREQDRWLPIANVSRIMKSSLPHTAKVSKDAKECVQECVSEFISFITSEAAEKCLNEKRKTINGEDILTSMRALGFDNYEGVLKVYLAKFREAQMQQARQKQLAADEEDGHKRGGDDDEEGPRAKKKSRGKRKREEAAAE